MIELSMSKPTFYFDNSCDVCCYWTTYWKKMTGDQVDYVAFERPEEKTSPEYVDASGTTVRGAEAVIRLLANHANKSWMLWWYTHVKPFAMLSEFLYGRVTACRTCAGKASTWIWGEKPESIQKVMNRRLLAVMMGLGVFGAFVIGVVLMIGSIVLRIF